MALISCMRLHQELKKKTKRMKKQEKQNINSKGRKEPLKKNRPKMTWTSQISPLVFRFNMWGTLSITNGNTDWECPLFDLSEINASSVPHMAQGHGCTPQSYSNSGDEKQWVCPETKCTGKNLAGKWSITGVFQVGVKMIEK